MCGFLVNTTKSYIGNGIVRTENDKWVILDDFSVNFWEIWKP